MSQDLRALATEALRGLTDPISGLDLIESGIARAITVEGAAIRFVLDVPAEHAAAMKPLVRQAEARLAALRGVRHVSGALSTAAAPRGEPAPPAGAQPVEGVAHIIAIASGKGGVGKSTVAANLAVALAAQGRRVGLLDADLHGPSQPRMMGVSGRPPAKDKILQPLYGHGVALMSLGLLSPEESAVIWRGPKLMGALQQMLFGVEWGGLDCLIIDLPPGTGDVQLTLSQKARLDGAIVVSTPQDVALMDASRAIDMFIRVGVPVLGLIENMAVHVCRNCGHPEHIFGHGGVSAEAARLGVPLMAELPLDLDTRIAGDAGLPVALSAPESPVARAFAHLAGGLIHAGIA